VLNFTNQSRSYDATRHAVRFWGYDGALEVSFFVTDDALRCLQPGASANETHLLAVFEAHRDPSSRELIPRPGGCRAEAA
jgi:Protein of unknown function (DUF1488)